MISIALIHEVDSLHLIDELFDSLVKLGYNVNKYSEVTESDSKFFIDLVASVDVVLIVNTSDYGCWTPPNSFMWRVITLLWKTFSNSSIPTNYAVIPISFRSSFGALSNGLGNRQIYAQSTKLAEAVQAISDEITAFIVQRGYNSGRKRIMSTEQQLLKVLAAIKQLGGSNFTNDTDIAQHLGWELEDVQDYMDILTQKGWTQAANSFAHRCSALTAHGRTVLRDPEYASSKGSSTVINVTGNQGVIVNANSILKDVTQAIDSSSHFPQDSKDDLRSLIIQLNEALDKVSSEHSESTEAIAETAKSLVEASDKDVPNKTLMKISAEGLQQAAKNIATVAPTVANVVNEIIATVSRR